MGGEPARIEQPRPKQQRAERPAPPTVIQKKLEVGSVDDPLEHEADRIARLVVGMSRSPQGDVAADSRIRQRDGVARSTRPDGGAAEATRVRRRPDADRIAAAPIAVGRVQRAAAIGRDGGALDADSERLLQSAQRSGGGTALDGSLQRRIGGVLGADVSGVRLHEGTVARELNDRISAKAFTVGRDVFFRDGVPDTNSPSGLGLVAHEVTHTVQQGASPGSRRYDDRDETEAAETESSETVEETTELAEETESAETEGEEVELSGTIPDIREAVAPEDVTGLGNREEDGRRAARAPAVRRDADTARHTVPLELGVNVGTSSATRRRANIVDEADQLVGGAIGATGQVSGPIPTTEAFGAMTTNISVSGVSWKLVKGKISIDLTIDGLYEWEVCGGGNIDVSTADSPVVTAENYEEISKDLTPKMEGKCWRPPRQSYWSEALTERHEKYHASDADGWVKKKGPGVVKSYLKKNPIALTDEERKDGAVVGRKVAAVVEEARAQVVEGRRYYFRKNITDYLKYPGEIRAFGDGKAPYAKLAKDIKTHGKKLAKAKTDKAKADKAKA